MFRRGFKSYERILEQRLKKVEKIESQLYQNGIINGKGIYDHILTIKLLVWRDRLREICKNMHAALIDIERALTEIQEEQLKKVL